MSSSIKANMSAWWNTFACSTWRTILAPMIGVRSWCWPIAAMTTKRETVVKIPGSPRRTFIVLFWSKHSSKESNTMFGPGTYRPDPTEGITALAELPQPEIVPYSRNETRHPCPRCGHSAYRDKQSQRALHDLGNLDVWCPRALVVTYSQHYCTKCRKYFNADLADLAPPGSHYTHRVIDLAVRIVVED